MAPVPMNAPSSPPPPGESPLTGSAAFSPRWALAALWLLVFTGGSQVMVVTPILPRIAEQLGTAESLLGTLVSVYAAMTGLVAVGIGPVSDRVGRRNVLLWGSGLMSVALALHGLADSFASLLVVRGLAGAAGGVLSGAAVAYVGDAFPVHQRGWANGWVMSGIAAGQILGIPAGAVLADRLGFRAPFLAFALLMVAVFMVVWHKVPQPNVARAQHLTLGSAWAGYRNLLARSEVRVAVFLFVLMFGGTSLFITYLPTFLEMSVGMTPDEVAGLFLAGGLSTAIAGPMAGRLSDRIGRKRIIIAASVLVALAMAATPFVVSGPLTAYALFFIAMAGFSGRASPFQALLTEMARADQRGSLMALTVAIGQIGSGVGSAVSGPVYTGFGTPAAGYAVSAVAAAASVLLMAVLLWWGIPEPKHKPAARA